MGRSVTLAQFVRGLSAIAPTATKQDRMRVCFGAFDLNGDGFIDPPEMQTTFTKLYKSMAESGGALLFAVLHRTSCNDCDKSMFLNLLLLSSDDNISSNSELCLNLVLCRHGIGPNGDFSGSSHLGKLPRKPRWTPGR